MAVVQEFKQFISKGNVIDLAVGVIIGAAFGSIVSSLVNDVLTPLIGAFTGGIDVANRSLSLHGFFNGGKMVTVKYGAFIQAAIDFFIIAVVIFLIVKGVNSFRKKQESGKTPPPPPSPEEKLLTEIRDILKKEGSER